MASAACHYTTRTGVDCAMRIPLPKCLKRLGRGEDGIAALEFAFIAPVLLLLVMGTVEVGLMMTAQVMMESATYTASRLGKTGYVEKNKTREATIRAEIARVGGVIMDPNKILVTSFSYKDFNEVEQPEPFVDANKNGKRDNGENFTDVNGNGKYDLDRGVSGQGAASNIVVYTSTYSWELFTPMISYVLGTNGKVIISARAVVKNEPYS